jgi:hypothetical protein
MSQDLRTMEWLYHIDLDPMKHTSRADLQLSAGIAWDIIQEHQRPRKGDRFVIAVVRPSSQGKAT